MGSKSRKMNDIMRPVSRLRWFITICMQVSYALIVSVPSFAEPGRGFTLEDTQWAEGAALVAEGVGIRGSSKGKYLVWIDSGELRVAREPDFVPEVLIPRGNGDPVVRFHISPDGRSIFYATGRKAADGEEPASDTRALWQVDTESKISPQLVASRADVPSDPVFAPGGQAFAFVEGGSLYEFRRNESGRWDRRTLLKRTDPRQFTATAIADVAYSPDSQQIAFMSERKGVQAYVAIHDITEGKTRYVDPSIYRDGPPVWSPDGTEVAFVRKPGNWTKTYRFTSRREAAPWSILAVMAKTGVVRTVWKADPGPGSVPWAEFDDRKFGRNESRVLTIRLLWTERGIIFPWEKTGWKLLYAVPARGGEAVCLTPGQGEVRNPVVSPGGQEVVFEANFGDLARRHLWRLSLRGGRPEPITFGATVERNPQFTAGGYLAYRVSYRDHAPPRFVVRSPHGDVREIPLLKSAADERRLKAIWKQFQPDEVVSVRAEDGVESWHLLIKPKTPPPAGGYPVVVYARGGPGFQTLSGADSLLRQYMASRGYMYVNINYRGSTGFGLDYRLPLQGGATGGSEVKDLAALAKYLQGRGDVNPKRIGIMGASYGGHLVGLAMSRLSKDYAAGASLYGVGDWVVELHEDQLFLMSGPPEAIRLSERLRIEDLAYTSSPTAHIENWRGPALFTVGELDTFGHVESVIDLGYQLLAQGVPVEFFIDPVGGHDVEPQEKIFDFFERALKR